MVHLMQTHLKAINRIIRALIVERKLNYEGTKLILSEENKVHIRKAIGSLNDAIDHLEKIK